MLASAVPLVPVCRRRRPFFADALARRIGASRAVIEGAGHEIQFTGQPINEAFQALWRRASSPSSTSTNHPHRA